MNFPQLIPVRLSITFLVLLESSTADAAGFPYHYSSSTGSYMASSTFDSNLQTLLKNLTRSATYSPQISANAESTVGSIPNEIFGIVLCSGDVNSSACYSCISQATKEIQNLCPYKKAATIYYDFCLLQFSNKNFLSSTDNSGNQLILHNRNNVSVSFTRFDNLVKYLINSTDNAVFKFNDTKKFGTSLMNMSNPFPVIRGLAQCTPDMSGPTCQSCLQDLISRMPKNYSGRQGGRIIDVRCNFQYRP